MWKIFYDSRGEKNSQNEFKEIIREIESAISSLKTSKTQIHEFYDHFLLLWV